MALILFEWLYSFFVLTGMGLWAVYLFKIRTNNLLYVITAGMFLEMLLLHFALIWLAANEFLYLFNFSLAFGGIYLKWNELREILSNSIQKLTNWAKTVKIIAFFIGFSILAKSAGIPYLVDNESYYIQSIKWLNEFGLVKGLANLHIFLGQMSGWHLLQSAFNFGFISNRLNDINGFLMLCFSLFSLHNYDKYLKTKNAENLFLAFIVCTSLLLFQFVSTPSPDLPIYLISQLIFYLFITNFKNYRGDFNFILILCIMLIMIKITAFPILILAFILALKHKLILQNFNFILIIGLISAFGFMLKNYIITGFLFYPTGLGGKLFSPDWQVPQEIQSMYLKLSNDFGWKSINSNQLEKMNFPEKIKIWIFQSRGFELLFNTIFLTILAIFPFFIKRKKELRFIWILAVLQLILLLATSPQYRFFMQFSIGLWLIFMANLLSKKTQLVKIIYGANAVILFLSLFINFDLNSEKFTNHQPQTFSAFEPKEILIPHQNSRYELEFKQLKEGNLIYNTPMSNEKDFFWKSFDTKIPAVNENLINWMKTNYGYRPQLRTNNLKDGFYSENVRE